MIHFLFAVDGDYKEYHLGEPPDPRRVTACLAEEEAFFERHLDNKGVHLVHRSDLAGDHFFDEAYLPRWRRFSERGQLGLHIHADRPNERHFYLDRTILRGHLAAAVAAAVKAGITWGAYRGGYYSLNREFLADLARAGIRYDLSGVPGKKITLYGETINDSSAMSPFAHRIENDEGGLWEIPIASDGTRHAVLERLTLANLRRLLERLEASPGEPRVVSIVTHTYLFTPVEYSDAFPPGDNIYPRHAITFKAAQALRFLARRTPLGGVLRAKGRSWSSLLMKRHLAACVRLMKRFGRFIALHELEEVLASKR